MPARAERVSKMRTLAYSRTRARDLNTMTVWILNDKGTFHSIDELIEREREEMGSFWPVLRESNQHTNILRTK
jgi:hypothetical protein